MFGGGSLDAVQPSKAAISAYVDSESYVLIRTRRVGARVEPDPGGAQDGAPKSWAASTADIACRPVGAAQCAVPFASMPDCTSVV